MVVLPSMNTDWLSEVLYSYLLHNVHLLSEKFSGQGTTKTVTRCRDVVSQSNCQERASSLRLFE